MLKIIGFGSLDVNVKNYLAIATVQNMEINFCLRFNSAESIFLTIMIRVTQQEHKNVLERDTIANEKACYE